MVKVRESGKEGHKRKYLVVIDGTLESERALFFAAMRAKRAMNKRIGLVVLYVIEPAEFQHWLGVENIMRAEAHAEAEKVIQQFVTDHQELESDFDPECVIREGQIIPQIRLLIEEDPDIAILVLAAGVTIDGPGPLVSSLLKSPGQFEIPVTIVPGNLTDEEIIALT